MGDVMAKDKRLYAQFTLEFPDSPKIAPLTDAAFRAVVEAVCYSRQHLTDGFISAGVARKRWTAEVLEELSHNHPERPTLEQVDGGWQIHDFAQHQMTRADIDLKRAAGAAGGRAKASNRLAGATDSPQQNATSPLARSESRVQSTETPRPGESSHYPAARETTDAMNPPSAMTVKLAGQQGVHDLPAVMQAIELHTGRRVDGSGAYRLCLDLLGKAKSHPKSAQRYVLRSIESSAFEVQQFIDRELIA